MSNDADTPTVAILMDVTKSDHEKLNFLFARIYEQLCGSAAKFMDSERVDHTLTPTVLVHEAYMKLVGPREIPWQNRLHFYAAAGQAMRRVLMDHAKTRTRQKRGGKQPRERISLDDAVAVPLGKAGSTDFFSLILDLEAALCRLEAEDPRCARVVEHKFYLGLETAKIALIMGLSETTVKAEWKVAKAFLLRDIEAAPEHS